MARRTSMTPSGRWTPKTPFLTPAPMVVGLTGHPLDDCRVVLSPQATQATRHIVELTATEVGWLGTCTRDGPVIRVDEIFLTDQQVSYAHTEMTPEAVARLANHLLDTRPDGLDLVGRIRFWGHSHGVLPVFPSQQDDDTMAEFDDGDVDYFVRMITNKKGDVRFDVWFYESRLRVVEARWEVEQAETDRTLRPSIRRSLTDHVVPLVAAGYGRPRPATPPVLASPPPAVPTADPTPPPDAAEQKEKQDEC